MTPMNVLFHSATSAQRARRRVEQSLAYAARILAMTGQKAGLAGQLSARSEGPKSYWTLRFRLGFDEVTPDDLIEVDADLNTLTGDGMGNPATRFHEFYADPFVASGSQQING
jgi:L-fuculose-phosphate aldolase